MEEKSKNDKKPTGKRQRQLSLEESFKQIPNLSKSRKQQDTVTVVQEESGGCYLQSSSHSSLVLESETYEYSGSQSSSPELGRPAMDDFSSDNKPSTSRKVKAATASSTPKSGAQVEMRSPAFLGDSLSKFRSMPACSAALKPLKAVPNNHIVLFETSKLDFLHPPSPYPARFVDKWHPDYVRMPCSSQSKYPTGKTMQNGSPELQNRWEMVEKALLNQIASPLDLRDAILDYNSRYSDSWKFVGLIRYLTEQIEKTEYDSIFGTILPAMVRLVLRLREICTQANFHSLKIIVVKP